MDYMFRRRKTTSQLGKFGALNKPLSCEKNARGRKMIAEIDACFLGAGASIILNIND